MKLRYTAPIAIAAAAAAIGLAPIAAAAPTATNTGGSIVVQSPGNVQVTAQPGPTALEAEQLQYPFGGNLGILLYHH